jgi:hypothetical protein
MIIIGAYSDRLLVVVIPDMDKGEQVPDFILIPLVAEGLLKHA